MRSLHHGFVERKMNQESVAVNSLGQRGWLRDTGALPVVRKAMCFLYLDDTRVA